MVIKLNVGQQLTNTCDFYKICHSRRHSIYFVLSFHIFGIFKQQFFIDYLQPNFHLKNYKLTVLGPTGKRRTEKRSFLTFVRLWLPPIKFHVATLKDIYKRSTLCDVHNVHPSDALYSMSLCVHNYRFLEHLFHTITVFFRRECINRYKRKTFDCGEKYFVLL